MDKFDYAYIDNGIDAWTNSGKLMSAQEEFSRRIQGKNVSEAGIKQALKGLEVWSKGWGFGSRTVTEVEVTGFYPLKGLATVKIANNGNMRSNAKIHWNPAEVVKSEPKAKSSSDLEKRVATLEKQVAKLIKQMENK